MKKTLLLSLMSLTLLLGSCSGNNPAPAPEEKYTVTWVNYDDSLLEKDLNVIKNSNPSYDGATPTRPYSDQFTYTFNGWSPALSPVISDITYKATYIETSKPSPTTGFTVSWLNYDQTLLKRDTNVPKGTMPNYVGETPKKPADEKYEYTFTGWLPALAPVTNDISYTAQYKANDKEDKEYQRQKTVTAINVDRLNSDIDALVFYVDEKFSTSGLKIDGTLPDSTTIDVLKYCTFSNTEIYYDDIEKGHYVDVLHVPSQKTCKYWISIYIPAEKDKEVTSVSVNDLSLKVGEETTLSATVKPLETYWQEVSWSIDKSDIAEIDAKTGHLKALKAGTATITATSVRYPKKSGSATLTVQLPAHDYGEVKIIQAKDIAKLLPDYETSKFVNSELQVTIKGKAVDVVDYVLTGSEDGGNKKPGKVILVDDTGYILVASATGTDTLYQNAKKYLDKPSLGSTYYTVTGTVACYRGVPEIQVIDYTWSETPHVTYDLNAMASNISNAKAFYDSIKTKWCSNNGIGVVDLVKMTGHCVFEVDDNSYIFVDQNNQTFNVYKPFGTGFAIGNEYTLIGFSSVYKWRGSLRVVETTQVGVKTSTYKIEDNALNKTIAETYNVNEPTNYKINEDYLKSNSVFYKTTVYVGFYASSNYYFVVGDNYQALDESKGEYTVATSKNNVANNHAAWMSNELYWNVDPNYISKGKLYPFALDNYTGVTKQDLDELKVEIYYTLNIHETDTGVKNTPVWKLSIVEDLVPEYGPDPEDYSSELTLNSSSETEYVASSHQTWGNDIFSVKQEKNGSSTFARETTYGKIGKNTKLSISLKSSDYVISTIVFTYQGSYSRLDSTCFGDNSYVETSTSQTVVLSTSSQSFKIDPIKLKSSDNYSKILNIKIFYREVQA